MAELDSGSVGIKVLTGLPENNGLPAIASEVLDDPHPVYALVELRPKREVTDIENDSHQVVLKIVQIEPLTGAAADRMRDQLRKVREKRTGVVPLPGVDGVEVPPAGAEGDAAPSAEPERPELPTGQEWGDSADAAPVPAAAEDTAPTAAVGVPPFAAPTPIGSKQRAQ